MLAFAAIPQHLVLAAAAVSPGDAFYITKAIYLVFFAFRMVMRLFTGRGLNTTWLTLLIVAGAAIFGLSATWKNVPQRTAQSAFTPDQMRSVQTVVTNYMRAHASSPSSIQFEDWSGLENNGADWSVIVRYKVLQRSGDWSNATVRFTIRGGTVTDAHVLRQS
ncbi:hypothetical protein [Chthoniobacter flavus]|uniref:hypothetical protein n=1 Tax=Chthoniobacter flavus TaxID=191863 RepID=UPI00104398EA|nr:hypothetical protein [Chthoniobacter flavus]